MFIRRSVNRITVSYINLFISKWQIISKMGKSTILNNFQKNGIVKIANKRIIYTTYTLLYIQMATKRKKNKQPKCAFLVLVLHFVTFVYEIQYPKNQHQFFSSLSLDVTRVYSNLYYSFGFIHFTLFSYFILLVYNVLFIRNTLEIYYFFFYIHNMKHEQKTSNSYPFSLLLSLARQSFSFFRYSNANHKCNLNHPKLKLIGLENFSFQLLKREN